MQYELNGTLYDVEIVRKNNRNTYLRMKEPNIIYVTTSYFTTKRQVKQLLESNEKALLRMEQQLKKREEKKKHFYYLGEVYDIITVTTIKKVEVIEHNIYTPSKEALEKWLRKQARMLFQERLDYYYQLMEESLPNPKLRIRQMKTRWGVCNRKSETITLNTELIHYPRICTDYVVVHELSHFTHFNHSKDFWNLVSKYCPNYKEIKKILKG